ncbi:MAG: hypothetical protein QXP16_03335 [Candidatus Bathyarchaeia archaeon]
MESTFCLKATLEEEENQGFLTCRSAKTASIRVAVTAGNSVRTTYGENVEQKDLILENN